MTLRWRAPVDGGRVAVYRIQRRHQAGGDWEDVASAMITEVELDRQERGVELEYRVLAVNKAGEGRPSNTVSRRLSGTTNRLRRSGGCIAEQLPDPGGDLFGGPVGMLPPHAGRLEIPRLAPQGVHDRQLLGRRHAAENRRLEFFHTPHDVNLAFATRADKAAALTGP